MAPDDGQAPVLVLGPLLRYIGETEATIWVETDRACQVEVLGHAARTFEVAGHHYALVVVTGLRPGSEHAYQVVLDGTVRWPLPDPAFGPSVLRTLDPGGPLRLAFGSCRVAELPPPRHRQRAGRERDHGSDAAAALAHVLAGQPRERWPHSMLFIGDQVYGDETGPATRQFIADRRDTSQPPGAEVADFEEYCALYREAWSEHAVRWLLSVVPTIMIFDDHDVHDDWNTSGAWRREFRAKPWWRARITGAYMSYWLYQHLGNLSPAELGKDDVWRQVQEAGDATAVLHDLAVRADAQADGIRWSVRRDFGAVRVVVIDSRSRRVVDDDRRRLMVDEAEWQWVTESTSAGLNAAGLDTAGLDTAGRDNGGFDHLVIATSLPLLLPHGIHCLEAWNEAVCAGAWGNRLRPAAERLRQAVDLEHWAAFGASFRAFEKLLSDLAGGPGTAAGGDAPASPRPASITVISGDIHHNYLAAVDLPAGPSSAAGAEPGNSAGPTTAITPRTAVYQAVCSPIHNLLPEKLRFGHRLVTSGFGTLITTAAARLARVPAPRVRWRVTDGPWFSNMLAELCYDGRQARIRFDRTVPDGSGIAGPPGLPGLEPTCEVELTSGPH
jgi:PhoD-like phosphatase